MPPCETQKLHEGEASIFQDIKFGCFTTMCRRKTQIFFEQKYLPRFSGDGPWDVYDVFIMGSSVYVYFRPAQRQLRRDHRIFNSCARHFQQQQHPHRCPYRIIDLLTQVCLEVMSDVQMDSMGKTNCLGLFSNIYII